MQGRLIKGVGGQYVVCADGQNYICSAKGSIKLSDKLFVGDFVEFQNNVICDILPRKNFLLRPSVCNVDQMLFLICPSPKPDFLLLDKLIIKCFEQKVDFVLGINKNDIASQDFGKNIIKNYQNVAKIIIYSAKFKQNLDELKQALSGKLTCLCGQSAVGKSSTLNALFDTNLQTNSLSKKIDRGQHTTRHSEIFSFGDTLICDTPGFSNFELNYEKQDLQNYYADFLPYNKKCRFVSCLHDSEPDCEVKQHVFCGDISQERYDRYLQFLKELQ